MKFLISFLLPALGRALALALAVVAAVLPLATAAGAAARNFWRWAVEQPSQSPLALGANTLTGLIPTLYEALHLAHREMIGFIPAVTRDPRIERAALNEVVRSPIGVAGDGEDITPGVNPANSGDTTVTYVDVAITKSRAWPIRWNGEEVKGISNTGMYNKVLADQFADAMRKASNEVEADLALCAKQNASRAYGTAGTTPFGTANDLTDLAGVLKILEDNGTPKGDLQFVGNSASWFNLRGKQSVLFKVNEAGSSDMLRNGMTDRLQGFAMRNSAGIALHTKGTGASYVTSGSTAVDVRDIALVTGSGTVLAGDVVTFAADTINKYVVKTGVSAPGTISLGKPGARVVIGTANAMTIGNNYTGNYAFARQAIVLATRAPALPEGGDSADDAMMLVDPFTGIAFEVRVYRQYRQVKYEVALAWGCAAANERYIATLLG